MEELKNELDNLIEQYEKRANVAMNTWVLLDGNGLTDEESGRLTAQYSCHNDTKAELERLRSLIKEEVKQ